MPITVTCSGCGKQYQVPDDRAGQRGRCPCGAELVVPSAGAQSQPAAPPPFATPGPPFAAPGPQQAGPQPGLGGGQPQPFGGPSPTLPGYGPPPQQPGPQIGGAPPPQPQEAGLGYGPPPQPQRVMPPPSYGYDKGPVERPVGVTILCVLNFVCSPLAALLSLLVMVGGGMVKQVLESGRASLPPGLPANLDANTLSMLVMAVGGVMLVMSVLGLVASIALWKGANWARITFIVLLALNALGSVARLFQPQAAPMGTNAAYAAGHAAGQFAGSLFGLAIIGVFMWILLSQQTKDFCSQ